MITQENLSLLVEAIPAKINPELVVILMAIGALIKHWKKLEKVQNKLIPLILGAVSLIVCLAGIEVYTMESIIAGIASGIVNAAGAVYCHQIGKNIFAKKTTNTDNTDIGSSVVF